MIDPTALDILKNAILLERRGKAFYAEVAARTSSPAVKDFFGMMAEEEDRHIQVLSDQYRAVQGRGAFVPSGAEGEGSGSFATAVLNDRLKKEISAASFEAASIAAAMTLERNAVRLYADRARAAPDAQERALYQWLAEWETEHLEFLSRVEHEVTEAVWNDNHFWPL